MFFPEPPRSDLEAGTRPLRVAAVRRSLCVDMIGKRGASSAAWLMTPLDLTRQAPRSARVELDGIAYLPRAIDKVRAALPGGNLGPYLVLHDEIVTLSALFYRRMGIAHDDFAAAVRDAQTDDDVAAWLRARVDDAKLDKWHAQVLGIRLCDIPSPTREQVIAAHPIATTLPETTFLVDIFDADDAALFAPR